MNEETTPVIKQEVKKKPKISDKMRVKLRKAFPIEAYSKIDSKSYLTSIKAMYRIERLNDVFGVGRWKVETRVVTLTEDYVLVQGKFISLDYDVELSSQYGGHKTTGKGVELADGYKSAVTDVTSKLASLLEVGIEVFKGNVTPDGVNKIEKAKKAKELAEKKAKLISPDTLRRIGEILVKNGGTTKELAKNILFEKYGIPHTTDVKKLTKEEGKKLLAKMLNPTKKDDK